MTSFTPDQLLPDLEPVSVAAPEAPKWFQLVADQTALIEVDESVVLEMKDILKDNTGTYKTGGIPRLPIVRMRGDMETLQEINAKTLAQRDRVTEISVAYMLMEAAADALYDRAQSKLASTPEWKSSKNQQERELLTVRKFSTLYRKRMKIKEIISVAREVQSALTHTHFTIKQQAEMGAIVLGHKSS